ncbi:hypothetical protein M407DRAFT_4181 [Tulasnella calospora MUT 4182]|uniref:Uncharacterized protein n=1 Tax=Tulasnella calospora MUT 4182 TaxID=1051891 RepID=A0A0C3QKB9_9AGAM|nr:hypothetical protein M407DRAFT_4181 [Tulasnella calospora MUT 4182]
MKTLIGIAAISIGSKCLEHLPQGCRHRKDEPDVAEQSHCIAGAALSLRYGYTWWIPELDIAASSAHSLLGRGLHLRRIYIQGHKGNRFDGYGLFLEARARGNPVCMGPYKPSNHHKCAQIDLESPVPIVSYNPVELTPTSFNRCLELNNTWAHLVGREDPCHSSEGSCLLIALRLREEFLRQA